MVDGVTSRPFSAKTLPGFKVNSSSELVNTIIENSKKRYARPSWMVEKEINEWSSMGGPGMTASGPISASGKYQAVCSSCGKTTTVPFEPQPGRPVYCQDCLAKIKAGELKPIPSDREFAPSPQVQNQQYSDLAVLGIEFEQQKTQAPAAPKRENFQPIKKAFEVFKPKPKPAFVKPEIARPQHSAAF